MTCQYSPQGNFSVISFVQPPAQELRPIVSKLVDYTNGDIEKLDSSLVETAFKSMIDGPNSRIHSKPLIVSHGDDTAFVILLSHVEYPFPSFVTLRELKEEMIKYSETN